MAGGPAWAPSRGACGATRTQSPPESPERYGVPRRLAITPDSRWATTPASRAGPVVVGRRDLDAGGLRQVEPREHRAPLLEGPGVERHAVEPHDVVDHEHRRTLAGEGAGAGGVLHPETLAEGVGRRAPAVEHHGLAVEQAVGDGVDEAGELGEPGGDVLAVRGAQRQLALVDVGEQADTRPVDLVAPRALDRQVAGNGEHREHAAIVPPPHRQRRGPGSARH